MLELGCGYGATQLLALEPRLKRGIGVDFQIAPELHMLEKFTFYQATIEEILPKLESKTLDVVMLISVLEHLAEPQFVLHCMAFTETFRTASGQRADLGWEAISGVVCIPAWLQSESRDRRP